MKRPSVHEIVFRRQFPHPDQNDPQNFYAHVQRNLVPEVRIEVQTFYGALDSLEAQYPGLDYTYEPHRRRLARYTWHRRLFRVFDELHLTSAEILSICQWEGTKSAKDKYEKETGRRIVDTTADCVVTLPRSEPKAVLYAQPQRRLFTESTAYIGSIAIKDVLNPASDGSPSAGEMEDVRSCISDADSDEIDHSIGNELNQQIMAINNAVSNADFVDINSLLNDASEPLQDWLKYMTDRHNNHDTLMQAIRNGDAPPEFLERVRGNITAASTDVAVAATSEAAGSSLARRDTTRAISSIASSTAPSQAGCPPATAEEMLAAL